MTKSAFSNSSTPKLSKQLAKKQRSTVPISCTWSKAVEKRDWKIGAIENDTVPTWSSKSCKQKGWSYLQFGKGRLFEMVDLTHTSQS